MAAPIIYPGADTSHWFTANAFIDPDKIAWHSTETPGGLPGYKGLTEAPNFTFDPWALKMWQHCDARGTARAFSNGRDSNGNTVYQTNRQKVIQVEISCYCNPGVASDKKIWNLSDAAYNILHEFSSWGQRTFGIPMVSTVYWKPYPSSYGPNNGVRLSPQQFTNYVGHLSHMHAPYNEHGDAGALDFASFLKRIEIETPTATTDEDDMYLFITNRDNKQSFLLYGDKIAYVLTDAEEINSSKLMQSAIFSDATVRRLLKDRTTITNG